VSSVPTDVGDKWGFLPLRRAEPVLAAVVEFGGKPVFLPEWRNRPRVIPKRWATIWTQLREAAGGRSERGAIEGNRAS